MSRQPASRGRERKIERGTMSKRLNIILSDDDFAQLEKLQLELNTKTKAELFRLSVAVTATVQRTMKNGGKVILEEKNGDRHRLILPTL